MKRVLVTGSGGQLGLTIQELCINYSGLEFFFKDSTELDITNVENVKECFTTGCYDYCINCAAYTNVEQAEKTPEIAYSVNAKGVENIAQICKENKVTLIHISTDYVFDGRKKEPYTINDNPNPINEYGKSKLAGERYIQEFLNEYYIIRTSWLYSKKYGKNFYRTILEKVKKGEDLKITKTQVGCPTETTNLTNFIINELIINDKEFGIHHYTDGVRMTWYSFAKTIIKNNELDIKISPKEHSSKVNRPTNSELI